MGGAGDDELSAVGQDVAEGEEDVKVLGHLGGYWCERCLLNRLITAIVDVEAGVHYYMVQD